MVHAASLSSLSPVVIMHITFALGALAVGPAALLARKGTRLHRASGYAWVTLMLGTALSAFFIRRHTGLNFAGFTPIHLLIVVAIGGLASAMWHIAHRNIQAHRRAMWGTYVSACLVAGAFTLLPGRYFGDLLWHHALRLV
jgi:uncharacterized membrane protein